MNTNHRAIKIGELTEYIDTHLKQLTGDDQQLGISQNFLGYIFVAGL